MFPLSCRNGDLSGQEKALEFMLFDLTSCVSPDSWKPPSPAARYSPATFYLDFSADCPQETLPIWRQIQWQAYVPATASISLTAATAATTAEFESAKVVSLAVAQSDTLLPGWDAALIDVGAGSVFYDASPRIVSLRSLRIGVTLTPTVDSMVSPILSSWQVLYDCKDGI
jgi:hypothetical protein